MNVQTNTPVRSVTGEGHNWSVNIDRGSVKADKVVYATNAFTSTLLPEFVDRITPFRGQVCTKYIGIVTLRAQAIPQCSAVVPTKAFSGPNMLTSTYSLRYGAEDYDYMIQRPKDGMVIIGGGRWKVPIEDLVGCTDDSTKLPVLTEHLRASMKTHMEGWGDEALGEGLLCDWTGMDVSSFDFIL